MITLRQTHERGQAQHGWLNSQHTFSFANYYDPNHMGFRTLRVINEDQIDGGTGFNPHSHQSMEIISYVIDGALEHQDSMGNKALIQPGEVQLMGAGSGVTHSEYNFLKDKMTHFLQIWILPKSSGGAPRYEQKNFQQALAQRELVLVVSPDGQQGSLKINQDASIWAADLLPQQKISKKLNLEKGYWLQAVRSSLKINGGMTLIAGDAVAIEKEAHLDIECLQAGDFLLFEL